MVHALAHVVSYVNFTDKHKAFLAAITSSNKPKSFVQVVKDAKRIEAMRKKIQALEKNKTWTLQELPKGNHSIYSK